MKNVKKDSENANILIIDDNNYLNYGTTSKKGKQYNPDGNLMPPNTNVILNISNPTITTIWFVNYNENNINFLGSTYSGDLLQIVVPGNISNCYAPHCRIQIDSNNSQVINSTFAMATTYCNNISFINNTIIQIRPEPHKIQFYLGGNNYTIKDNYIVYFSALGYNSEIRDDIILENNGPFYENPEMLNNSNYNTYFNEDNTLKSEYVNSVLFATENITNPVTINNKVTLTALRGYGGYSNINLIEGSDNSIIEDSTITKITINGTSYININNNKLLSDDSIIEVINSVENIIENNTINTKNTNTITFDAESFGTTVKHNELIANELTGDSSVLTTEDNTVEDNTPEYIEEEETLIILTEDNILNYATLTGTTYNLSSEKLNNKEVIINFNTTSSFYISQNFTLIADYNTQAHNLIGSTGYFYNITNLYAPQAEVRIGTNPTGTQSIKNSTVAIINVQNPTTPTLIQNNTIINLRSPYPIVLNGRNNTIINNYIIRYSGGTLQVGPYITLMNRGPSTFTGNTREYYPTNIITLTNTNYNTYFDVETNTIKETYANKILFAVENITSPIIINQKNVTLSAIRGIAGYTNVSFIEGSENSKIEDSYIKHLTINKTNNITIDENKLIDTESQIEIINSQNNLIENNTINTTLDYTIILKDSTNNNINNNQLNALELTNEESIQTITSQTELKVDTTQFTIGTTSNIQASIYLGDEVASNINSGKVVFKVNGVTLKDQNGKVIYAKVVNGAATIENYEIPKTWNKEEITITAVYSGSKDCEALRSEETKLTITPEQTNPPINTEQTPTTATIGQTIQLKAKITDQNNPITTGKVVFKVNGKTVKDANGKVIYANVDTNGEVTVNYTIPDTMKAKEYTITITFTSAKYETITTNTTITLTKT